MFGVISRLLTGGLIICALAIGFSGAARALILTGPAVSTGDRDNFTGTIGTRFTTGNAEIVINALGFEDSGGDGLAVAHQVGLWDATGTLQANATVLAGTSAVLLDSWRFVAIAPLTLLANTTYVLGGETIAGSGDGFTDLVNAAGFGSGLGIVDAATLNFWTSGLFAFPTNFSGGVAGRWGAANATFLTGLEDAPQLSEGVSEDTIAIPEPSTLSILSACLLGLFGLRRKQG